MTPPMRDLDATEAERLWTALSMLRARVDAIDARVYAMSIPPPSGTLDVQGPKGWRARGNAWAVVLVVLAIAAAVIVATI